ncbi:MAG: type IV-A pilus assembly ATPase PilB [Deltaproteobacteria bacterium]|nr:type IV-A pilus assembly ATPase PilB [Deltaproteobacteria bacterium]
MSSGNRLGELLVREKRISLAQLKQAQEEQKRTGKNISYALAKLGFISDKEITNFLAQEYRVPAMDLNAVELDPELGRVVTREVCEKHRIIPISRAGSSLIVAMSDPTNLHAFDDIKFLTGYNVEPVVASETAISAALDRMFAKAEPVAQQIDVDTLIGDIDADAVEFGADEADSVNVLELEKASEDAPVVRLCNAILLNAIKVGASDIHLEVYEKKMRVRYRVDGVLREEMSPPLRMKNAIASRVKIMSSLDIAERRLPQDGRIKLKVAGGKEMDFRVSVLPTIWGEKIVLRLLDKSNLQLDMTKLGFEKGQLELFMKAIHNPYGMCLVTGPTGSGKTTTLYSALAELNKVTENISTAEDPVEYNLPGINQVQMKEDIGLNFAASLRSFLRQDPDIIMVGEIRDFETAEIAVKAALTGHMVLSTLHTNDAPSTISRLLNMGIEPFMVTAATNLVLAQRLARRVCKDCKTETKVAVETLRDVGFSEEQLQGARMMRGVGCKTCNNTGYKGRVALYEVMPFWDELKEMVLQGASSAELKVSAIRCGLKTLRMSGIGKCLEGMTTIEEITRVTASDSNKSAS